MKERDALALFREYDDAENVEYPAAFDYKAAVARFRSFAAALDAATVVSHSLETESHIQDASFHSQIDLGAGWLRFSNFGEMVSLTADHEVSEATLAVVLHLCVDQGYIFIPTEFAELPYTGGTVGVDGIRDWGIRYFDWL